ncbi:AMP-binding protein [Corynebacterium testudinoris]|uniref:Acyl-CoA synthetase (AMP-forming)/AMP-acid ligase II n=1 Tax=Corynebacterium testudinoris TaxID=136857 RepID=A0A0G3H2V8_9CORY|nr:AMP-binding protein [Corynebacterium testudinoris]AKK07731.1 acyl-CoA synthetase (AMP-forming)/AMP-acid ligase II [Corynebacterium testudinoris]MBX8995841.1 AMP-binding protein [Corynebacterium testudinoris]
MFSLSRLRESAATARALGEFVPSVLRSGIVSLRSGAATTLSTPAVLARYWFTTAREVEQGHITAPHRLAIIDDDGELTYRQLRDNSQSVARHLLSLGLGEIRLGVMARNGRGIVYPLAAKGYAGAAIYLLNVGSSPEQLSGCLEENDINVLVIDEEFLGRLNTSLIDARGIHIIIAHHTDPSPAYPSLADIVARPWDTSDITLPTFPKHGPIVLMSSGTSGIPKGVIRPEPRLPLVLAGILKKVPWRADIRLQLHASIFHTWGWGALNIALAARGTIVTHRIFDPAQVLRDIDTYQLEAMVTSPVFLKQILEVDDNARYDTSHLEFIVSSGHALTPHLVEETIERFGPILCNVYGSTELTLASVASAEEIAADPTTSGEIATGTTLKILDDHGNEVPTGTPGRIYLRNSTTLVGYSNPTIPLDHAQGLISIGDLGYLDDTGHLRVLGRADDMIIVGGENVYPRSVDNVLDALPGIADVYSGGVPDDNTFQRIAVWIVRDDNAHGAALTDDAIRAHVRDNLAEHSIPRDVHFMDELPRNETGKVVPRLLPQ